jgi:hypothetical protein
MDKCPYCYTELGIHISDPITLPQGSPYSWINNTTLEYVGDISQRLYKGLSSITEDELIELQNKLSALEIDIGVTPLTSFSSIIPNKVQVSNKHIMEMRSSIEKILIALGMTKTEYFNYDEEGNHIIHPNGDKIEWTDPILDVQKVVSKAIHIEDLRHPLPTTYFEYFNKSDVGIIPINISPYYGYFYGDIGKKPVADYADRPWKTIGSLPSIEYTEYSQDVAQDPVTGWWYSLGTYTVHKEYVTTIPVAEVVASNYVKGSVSGTGYIFNDVRYLPWLDVYGAYKYRGSIILRYPGINVRFDGRWTIKRPEIIANKILTYDLSGSGSHSEISLTPSPGLGTRIHQPTITFTIYVCDKQIGGLGVVNFKSVQIIHLSADGSFGGTFTYDVWNLITKLYPTYKYIHSVSINAAIQGDTMGGTSGDWGSQPVANVLVGNVSITKADNIGLKTI